MLNIRCRDRRFTLAASLAAALVGWGSWGAVPVGAQGLLPQLEPVGVSKPTPPGEEAEPVNEAATEEAVETDAATAAQSASLGVEALLTSDDVWPETLAGPIWAVTPRVGFRLIQVPVVLDPDAPGELSASPIGPAGGQFLAFRIDPLALPVDADTGDTTGPTASGTTAGVTIDFGGTASSLTNTATTSASPPPLLTRRVTVTRDGLLRWEMDRAIPGAEVREGADDLYLLKLRRDRLTSQLPERPATAVADSGSGSDPRLLAQQRRDAELAYRQAQIQYRDLASSVQSLPETFTIPMPAHVWAVYQVRDRERAVTFEGPSPLPWTLDLSDLSALHEALAAGASGGAGTGADDLPAIATVERLLNRGTPLDTRVAVLWASTLDLPAMVTRGDRGYRLLEKLLAIDEGDISRNTLASILAVQPPTPATLTLLASMESQMAPGQRLESLALLLGADVTGGGSSTPDEVTPQQIETRRERVDAIARLLADPSAPPPGDVLDQVAQALEPQPEAQAAVIGAIDLTALPPDRTADVIRWVVGGAGRDGMATQWLQGRLLAPDQDPAIRLTTLEALAPAGVGTSSKTKSERTTPPASDAPTPEPSTSEDAPNANDSTTPGGRSLMGETVANVEVAGHLANTGGGSVAGAAKQLTRDMIDRGFQPGTAQPASDDGAANEASPGDEAMMEEAPQPIPMESMADPMFSLIRSDDPAVRDAAWAALPRFVIAENFQVEPDPEPTLTSTPGVTPAPDPTRDPYAAVIAAGLAGVSTDGSTPPGLVPFLVQQPDDDRVVLGLIQLVIVADDATAAAAGEALVGSNLPIESGLAGVIPAERAIFAARLYSPATADEPPITALLADTTLSERIAPWFARSVAEGELPPTAAWVQAMGGRDAALTAAASTDKAVANAALHALVASLNGDQALHNQLATRFNEALNKEGGDRVERIRQAWTEIEEARTVAELAARTGRYRLMLTARDPQQPAGFLGRVEPRVRESQLALVDLEVDGRQPKFAGDPLPLTLSEEELALRIVPTELTNINNELITALPLAEAPGPIDLRPQPDGSWRGQSTLPDGTTLELRMEPLK